MTRALVQDGLSLLVIVMGVVMIADAPDGSWMQLLAGLQIALGLLRFGFKPWRARRAMTRALVAHRRNDGTVQ